jgi:Fe-S-cluster containining protein
LKFPCICCGTCCSKYQPRLSKIEAHRIADKLKISWDQFRKEYTDPRWPGTQSFLIKHTNGACLFLKTSADKKQKICLIHDIKPDCCREWIQGPDRPECREGLKMIWGLTIDDSGRIFGLPEKLEAFQKYLIH